MLKSFGTTKIFVHLRKLKHKNMTHLPSRSKMMLTLESLNSRLMGIANRIPKDSFDKIINSILATDFVDSFSFDCRFDSESVWEEFETFTVEAYEDGYLVVLDLRVRYEVSRGEVVNDVIFEIDEMTTYNADGEEFTIDYVQADMILDAVKSKKMIA